MIWHGKRQSQPTFGLEIFALGRQQPIDFGSSQVGSGAGTVLIVIETSITDAKAHLSSLVEAALQGEEVILDRAGKPVARIVPYRDPTKSREPGGLEGLVLPDDFDDPDPEIERLFAGDESS